MPGIATRAPAARPGLRRAASLAQIAPPMSGTSIELYSDFTCPFSYVVEAALLRILEDVDATLRYRAYELFPAPATLPPRPEPSALRALDPLARELGLRMRVPGFTPRTRKAHEAACFAREHGRAAELRDALYRAYWERAEDIGRIDVLVALGEQSGLDATALKIALDIDAFADEVAADRIGADRQDVRHTPTAIVRAATRAERIVGAHPLAELRAALAEITSPPG